jgi:osmotically-inducible protein OsmY
MARRDDRERRWRDEEPRHDRDRQRWNRGEWREQERGMEREGWQNRQDDPRRQEGNDWMSYGRGENWGREGQFGGGRRHQGGEEYDFDQSRRMSGGEDWGYGRMSERDRDEWNSDFDRGYQRGGRGQEYYGRRSGRQDREFEGGWRGQQDWDHERQDRQDYEGGRGERGQQDWGRQGRQDFGSERSWRGQQDWGRQGRQDYEGERGWRGQQDWSRQGRRVSNPYDDYDYDYDEPMEWTYTEIWEIEGPYSGMGPQGYRRSDDRIFEDVCERLTMHGQIDPSDVEIEVEDGEVILKGNVDDRHTKRIIEDVAYSVTGVSDVQNNLRVSDFQSPSVRYGYGPGESSPGREQRQRFGRGGMYSGSTGRTGKGEHLEEPTGGMYSGSRGRTGTGGSRTSQTSDQRTIDRDQIREGMRVVGADDGDIGSVKEVHNNEFLVDRPLARDVYVPFHACQQVSGDRIRLNVREDEVNDQGWRNPEILGDDDNT